MAVEGFDNDISWSKFKKRKVRPKASDADGYTYAIYRSSVKFGYGEGKAIVVKSADFVVELDSKESWVVEDKMNDELLKHEQGHYDITALGAREVYAGLFKLQAKDSKALTDSVKDLNDRIQKKIDDTNKRYDKQTDHSRNKVEQEKWNKAISNEKLKPDGSIDNLP